MQESKAFIGLVPAAVLSALLGVSGPASAASPAYCALYAREISKEYVRTASSAAGTPAEQRIQDQAFYKCLNMDEEPALPETSAYADVTDDADAVGGPFVEPGTEPATAAEAPEPDPPPVPAPKPAAKPRVASGGKFRGSGLEPWTPEWRAWCAEHFPNSFDPKTGTIVPYGGARTLCR